MPSCWQSKPWSAPGDWWTSTKPDWAPVPILDTIWSAAKVVDDEVVKPITMSLPNLEVVAPTARSGAMPGLNTKRLVLVALPDWKRLWLATLTSYQRDSAPAPPATACAVHRAVAVPWAGSTAVTAWSSRPSRVSRWMPLPFCGADAGALNDETLTAEVAVTGMIGVPFDRSVTWYSSIAVAGSLLGVAAIHPVVELSACCAGFGVAATAPVVVLSPDTLPVRKVLRAGHVVMVPVPAGLVMKSTSEPTNET